MLFLLGHPLQQLLRWHPCDERIRVLRRIYVFDLPSFPASFFRPCWNPSCCHPHYSFLRDCLVKTSRARKISGGYSAEAEAVQHNTAELFVLMHDMQAYGKLLPSLWSLVEMMKPPLVRGQKRRPAQQRLPRASVVTSCFFFSPFAFSVLERLLPLGSSLVRMS